ncbi:uncharacterized protein [Chelonus insularis]|uniref:uncharacterized protein n=1 Tax=Chelonus insularis TaxID=460826 RepID=UPI001589BE46|nr:uncharacterized protein LOC118065297 [Chelonus insularis]
MIVDIIVCELLRIPRHVTNDDLSEVAQQIVLLFEEECVETFYIPPVKKRDSRSNLSEVSKGKLPDKLRNLRTIIREAARIGKEVTIYTEKENHDQKEIATAEESKIWLVHNRESTEVLNHWNSSYILREIDLDEKNYASIEDVLNNWPILKESKSFELIEKDFDRKFPNAGNTFILEWDKFFGNLLNLYGQKITDQDSIYVKLLDNKDSQLRADSKTAIQFYLLASLMAPKSNKTRVKKKEKTTNNERLGFWKPSIAESREGFILHVQIPGDIETRIYSKQKALIQKGLHLQPLVIAIGEDLTNITKSYVRFESVTYELPSLLKAIDVLFKIYLVFNLAYPLECENFCYLIQWGVYQIKTKSDTKIPLVFNTLNKLKPKDK